MDLLRKIIGISSILLLTASCSFNPFRTDNQLTGSPVSTAVGAGVGAGGAAIAGASNAEIGLAGIAGGAIGYYVSTLRFASGGVMHAGGQVYNVGEYVTIVVPTDELFDVNSAELLPGAGSVLDSVVAVLNRYPNNSILISGNTSGYYSQKFERKLSEDRAKQVAAYLWAHGINDFEAQSNQTRALAYVGYSHHFPIANDIQPKSILQNSRIQITSYPSKETLGTSKKQMVFNNIGESSDDLPKSYSSPDGREQVIRSSAKDAPTLASNNTPNNVKGEMWDDYNRVDDK